MLAGSGESDEQCPLPVPAVLVPGAAPRRSCSQWRRQMDAAYVLGALELAGEEVLMGFQGSQSPVQKIHKSPELGIAASTSLLSATLLRIYMNVRAA